MDRNRRTLSRRRVIAGGAATGLGVAGLLISGCGDDNSSPKVSATSGARTAGAAGTASGSATGTAKRGGTLNAPQTTQITEVLDPHTAQNNAAFFYSLIGNLALHPSVDGKSLVAELAASWEVPSDGTQITLKVRPGAKWHNKAPTNGRAVTAEDLAFNINDIAGKNDPSNVAKYQRRSTLPNLDSATATDDQTVVIKLTAPHSGFLNGLGDWRNSIVPKDFAQANNWDAAGLVGSGPFIIDAFTNNVSATFKRNPDYWDTSLPYLDGVKWTFFSDPVSALTAFAQGQVDWQCPVAKTDLQTVQKLGSKFRQETWRFADEYHLRFNPNHKPFDDPRVRRALSLVVDYKAAGDGYYGDGFWDYTGPLSSGFPQAWQPDKVVTMDQYNAAKRDANIATAKQLMTAAGYPDGNLTLDIFPFSTANYLDAATRALNDFKQVWPKLNGQVTQVPDAAAAVRRQTSGDYDIESTGSFPFPHVSLEAEAFFSSAGSRNYEKFSNADIDALIVKLSSEMDEDTQVSIVNDLETQLLELAPQATLYAPRITSLFSDKVSGATGFGGVLGGGSYDVPIATKGFWLG